MIELRKTNRSSLVVHWSPVVGHVIITCMIKRLYVKQMEEQGNQIMFSLV